MIAAAVRWVGGVDGFLELIDQRRLPGKLVRLKCRNTKQLYHAIKTLTIRGAPAIGVAGAYGLVLAAQKFAGRCLVSDAFKHLKKTADYLRLSRPTAVNLSWALGRVMRAVEKIVDENPKTNLQSLRKAILKEARTIYQEDVEMCQRIGRNGQKFIRNGSGILTHCNAGALATAGQGTALSIMFEAHRKGKKFKVYVDETRPMLQGARLTAWELKQAKIDVVVICDNMAGWLMKQGKINAVITGADRIAANGDSANKIGTYSLSVLAREHCIPFYLAAPSSTFDLSIKSGGQIPIEQRPADEVRFVGKEKAVPNRVKVYNPAFDVTPAENITAIISEKGIIRQPTKEKIRRMLVRKPWRKKTRKLQDR